MTNMMAAAVTARALLNQGGAGLRRDQLIVAHSVAPRKTNHTPSAAQPIRRSGRDPTAASTNARAPSARWIPARRRECVERRDRSHGLVYQGADVAAMAS